MPFDFEALVGHLYVVGGRAVSMAPPGVLVEVAPKRAARGRETDTFFTLVLPSGQVAAPATFYERMAQMAAERYFDTTGSVTSGLREVFNAINQNLIDHNQREPDNAYEANLLCAVLRGDDLIIARMGAGVAIFQDRSEIRTIPANLSDDESLYQTPLGVDSYPDVLMTRFKASNGARMIFCDANVADLPLDRVYASLDHNDIGAVLVGFKEIARLQLTLLAVEFVPPETPAPMPVPEGESTLQIAEVARAAATKSRGAAARKERNRPPPVLVQNVKLGVGKAARTVADGLELTNRTIEHYFDKPPEPETPETDEEGEETQKSSALNWISTSFATGTAVLIPIVMVALVVVLWLSGTGESEFEVCIQQANELAVSAREVPSSSPENQLALWNATITEALRCLTLREGDETATALVREGQEVVDRINLIERREAVVMESLPGAVFTRILLEGSDVYVLDSERSGVYHAILSDDGQSLSRQRLEPILDMRQGATIRGFAVGEIIDIAFSQNQNTLLALDNKGQLIVCERRQKQGCDLQTLLRWEDWVNPVAITIWGNDERLYILDPGVTQIWRYDRLNGSYSGVPSLYFDGQNDGTAIANAIDFAIDRPGNVYILRADGVMLQYNLGQIRDFRLGGFPEGQQPNSAFSMFLDEDPLGRALYVVRRNPGTIYQLTQGGAYWATYRVFDEAKFESLSGVVSNPGQQFLYAISGNTIFRINQAE